MPVTPAVQRSSLLVPGSANKRIPLSAHLSIPDEDTVENDSVNERIAQRRPSDSPRRSTMSSKQITSPSKSSGSQSQSSRRVITNDVSTMRNRSNTDVQTGIFSSNGLKQQLSASGGGSDKSLTYYSQQQQRQSPPPRSKCTLPSSTCPQGYVTPSKLFNMMGYGLENKYLLMHAHYLYIIDCRSRETFDDNHIITAIHWEDALNDTVYISVVERFSEIVLYDEKGISLTTTPEISRVSSRFSQLSSKPCILLAGGFEAFRTLFPFVCTQSDVRSTVDREKFLTIYPSVVLDNQLYLGTGHQATNWKVVRDLKLTHIINISVEHQCVFADRINYLHIELEDKEDVYLKNRFNETIHFINMAFQNPSTRVLIHCNLGISRSSTLLLAYLMKKYNATLYEAYKFLRHRRPIVCPNLGFLRQLLDYEHDLFSYVYTDINDQIFH